MPLKKSGTNAARGENIAEMIRAGYPPAQAAAAAYRNQREHKAGGGQVGDVPPLQPLQITPQIRARMERRAANASDDNALKSVVNDAAKYGVDWSHLLGEARGGSVSPYPMAAGGNPLQAPWYARAEAHGLEHSGFIHSPTAGRTDKLPMAVPGGSHVIPADVVSAVGQGNSLAGAGAFNRLFHQGPYGSAPAHIATPHAAMGIRQKFEQGGTPSVDIAASGGEYIVKPESVALIGGGDMKKGHDAIDHMILQLRKKHIKTLRNLKPPKKS